MWPSAASKWGLADDPAGRCGCLSPHDCWLSSSGPGRWRGSGSHAGWRCRVSKRAQRPHLAWVQGRRYQFHVRPMGTIPGSTRGRIWRLRRSWRLHFCQYLCGRQRAWHLRLRRPKSPGSAIELGHDLVFVGPPKLLSLGRIEVVWGSPDGGDAAIRIRTFFDSDNHVEGEVLVKVCN